MNAAGAPDERRCDDEPVRTPVRLSLAVRVFIWCSAVTIVVRSGLNTFMHHTTWRDDLDMHTVPLPLPSAVEREAIAQGRSPRYESLPSRLLATGASVLRFANPLPPHKTRRHLTDAGHWLMYAAVWVHTRLEFTGRLIGVDERWTMFSPTVGTTRTIVRTVLSYSDGVEVSVRSRAEPDDLTGFVRPFAQRRLQHDLNLTQLEDVRLNWCRWLARVRPTSSNGAPLHTIALYEVRYRLPAPDVDPTLHWQNEQERALPSAASWLFDVSTGKLSDVRKDRAPTGAGNDGD